MGTPKLIVLSEQFRGKSFDLTKDLHTVGRVNERDICIKDATISSYHCEFEKNGESYILRDKGSTNGSRVNNVPLTTEQELHNSDILQIGGIEILYDCDDKSVTTVMRTQTGIDLDNTDFNVNTVQRMDNFDSFKGNSSGGGSHKIMVLIVALLAVIVIGLIGYVVFTVIQDDKTSEDSKTPAVILNTSSFLDS